MRYVHIMSDRRNERAELHFAEMPLKCYSSACCLSHFIIALEGGEDAFFFSFPFSF